MATDSAGKLCPFCPQNGQVSIIAENRGAYLIQAVKNGAPAIGRYLIIPKQHLERLLDRPNRWTRYENELLIEAFAAAYADTVLMELMDERDLNQALNTAWNQGKWAGQTISHIHNWVVFRYDDLGIGTDALIEREIADGLRL